MSDFTDEHPDKYLTEDDVRTAVAAFEDTPMSGEDLIQSMVAPDICLTTEQLVKAARNVVNATLPGIIRRAKADAWDEGVDAAALTTTWAAETKARNPYRKDTEA